jgi:hypothetical protein
MGDQQIPGQMTLPIGTGKPPAGLLPKRKPRPEEIPPRTNYPNAKGQMVIGLKNPEQFHELDQHGNVYDRTFKDRDFKHNGPQFGHNNDVWDKHAKRTMISVNAVLHTGQHADDTGDHSYIHGPLDPNRPTSILVRGGTPWIVDGHHRLAEARGRGDTHFSADVLNKDQMPQRQVAKIGKKDQAGLDAHFLNDHVHPDERKYWGSHGVVNAQAHEVMHRNGLHTHAHQADPEDTPQNMRSEVPAPKRSFMDNAQPAQFGVRLMKS